MSKEKKKTMAPKLRFPEFREEGEWKESQLKDVCQMQAGKFVPASEIYENINEGFSPCYGGNGLRGYTKSYTHKGKYPLIGRQGALCGNVTLASGKFHATEHAVVATPKKSINTDWLFYMLTYLNLNKYATGQAQPGLSVENLEKIDIKIPKKEKEQQKIAATLTSLDDLIAAQSEKIKALQAHKKGLMQRIFPAEGETTPRVRFAEFREAWQYKTLKPFLEEYFERVSANTDLPIFSSTRTGLVSQKDYYSGRELLNEGEYGVVPKGYFVYRHMSDDATFKFNINEDFENIAVSREYPVFRTIDLNSYFLLYKLNEGADFKKFAEIQKKGGTRTRLYFKTLCTWRTLLPSPQEQQKIAACLISLDDLIAAQSEKLEALKAHKKGLMQQMFPNPNEMEP